jgi:caa(3)-type oxidase subunit IV
MSEHAEHSPKQYVKIWAILLVLLVISILGPMLEVKILTLITAFGIALIKALIVAAYFMHLNVERRYIWYILFTMLLMVTLFYAGVMTDIGHTSGSRWENKAANTLILEHSKAAGAGESEHHD